MTISSSNARPVWGHRPFISPVGVLHLYATPVALTAVLWPQEREGRVPLPDIDKATGQGVLDAAEHQLDEYFSGKRRQFDLPLQASGTDFQKNVWQALSTIPFGETRSYRDIARQIDKPAAIRAVGTANGRNPLSIIVPCHRVIGTNGTLTGFAGGLATKQWLLQHEAPAQQQAMMNF